MHRKQLDPDRVSKALGSARVVPVSRAPSRGPLDLLQLRVEVERRLKSSGGRPTDPEWKLSRVVRFKPSRWTQLEELAAMLSQQGSTVSSSQLAAMLIERGLSELSLTPPSQPRSSAAGGAALGEPGAYPAPLIGDEHYSGLGSVSACLEAEG
jgi:hypothetical protein